MRIIKLLLFSLFCSFLFSCSSSVKSYRNPGKEITRSIKRNSRAYDNQKNKKIKACEKKYIRKSVKIHAKEMHRIQNTDFSSPFFSTYEN